MSEVYLTTYINSFWKIFAFLWQRNSPALKKLNLWFNFNTLETRHSVELRAQSISGCPWGVYTKYNWMSQSNWGCSQSLWSSEVECLIDLYLLSACGWSGFKIHGLTKNYWEILSLPTGSGCEMAVLSSLTITLGLGRWIQMSKVKWIKT